MVRFQGKAHGFRKTEPVQKVDRMDLIIVMVSRRGDGMSGFFVSHLRPFEQAGHLNRDRHKGKDQESQIQLSIYIWSGFHSVSAKSNRSGCVNASPGPLICRGAFSYMNPFKAIDAMSENRVIGRENGIPWNLPEAFKWFKKMTTAECDRLPVCTELIPPIPPWPDATSTSAAARKSTPRLSRSAPIFSSRWSSASSRVTPSFPRLKTGSSCLRRS